MVTALGTALLAVAACGGGGEVADETEVQRIDSSGGVYTIDDFLAVGFKKSKQYDVTGLPGGIEARLGFFGPNPQSRKQFELRFYASHKDAVEQGISLAEEVTGPDAAKHRLTPTWEEGARDRWVSSSGGHYGGVGVARSVARIRWLHRVRQRTDPVRRHGFGSGPRSM